MIKETDSGLLVSVSQEEDKGCDACNNAEQELTVTLKMTCPCGGDVGFTGEILTVNPPIHCCICVACSKRFHVSPDPCGLMEATILEKMSGGGDDGDK